MFLCKTAGYHLNSLKYFSHADVFLAGQRSKFTTSFHERTDIFRMIIAESRKKGKELVSPKSGKTIFLYKNCIFDKRGKTSENNKIRPVNGR